MATKTGGEGKRALCAIFGGTGDPGAVQLPSEGFVGARAQRWQGDRVKVVSAFRDVAAGKKGFHAGPIRC